MKGTGSGNKTMHVPVYPAPRDPSHNNPTIGQRAPIRQTVTMGPMLIKGKWANRRRPSGRPTQTASFRVAVVGQVLSPGELVLWLGDYKLISGVDFVPVANDNAATATAVTVAIGRLPGFTATSTAQGDVNIVMGGQFADQFVFSVHQYGDVVHATNIVPTNGLMAYGANGPSAPLLA